MSIEQTVVQVRAKYTFDPNVGPTNDQCAAICNEVAWIHRNDPEQWGVSGKNMGNNGTLSDGAKIAVDIVQNGLSLEIFDCLYAAGGPDAAGKYGPASPQWNAGGVLNDPARPWKAPINPGGQPPIPPQPPTGCPCKAEFAALTAQVAALSDQVGALTGLVASTAADTQDRLAQVEAIARVGRPFRFRQFGMTVNGAVDPVK